MIKRLRLIGGIAVLTLGSDLATGQTVRIPLVKGLTVTSALVSKAGDREAVVTVASADSNAVTYSWTALQQLASGEPRRMQFIRAVRSVDLQTATRLNSVFYSDDNTEYPGYTAFTVSTAVFDALKAGEEVGYSVVSKDTRAGGIEADLLSAFAPKTIRRKGTLRRVGNRAAFPLLLNGRRVSVDAMAVRGHFEYRGDALDQEFLLLDQRDHPLILRVVTGEDVYQIVRVDLIQGWKTQVQLTQDAGPAAGDAGDTQMPGGSGGTSSGTGAQASEGTGKAGAGGPSMMSTVEQSLRTQCRAELPGVYFEFAKADLTPASNATLTSLAEVLSRHRDWRLSIEGHTDDIGADADNQALSEGRAIAVKRGLAERGVQANTLATRGFGETRPVESNATLEGRARNRRVELVRSCTPGDSR